MSNNTGHKNISRYSCKRVGTGLQVRVQWRNKIHYRRFPDRHYDNPTETLLAALEWRDEIEILLGKPRTERRITSGSGIYLSKDFYGKEYWVAQCSPSKGKSIRKCFSVKKYGDLSARFLATCARHEMEQSYYGGTFGVRIRRNL